MSVPKFRLHNLHTITPNPRRGRPRGPFFPTGLSGGLSAASAGDIGHHEE